ncbi:MAG TPA: hypothetical protein VLJ37_06350, partial [bacterium]|nr:hypothetical protein [bacterium]
MSITITVGNQKPVQIEDKGAEGVIDTPEDATAALTVLGNDEKLTANGKEYTRDELVKIRDDAPKSEAGDQATARGEGVSHGVFVQGAGSGGFDKDADPADPESRSHKGHNGGRVRVGYQAGIPVMNGEHQLNVDLRAGLEVGHAGTEYETPGGETATSSYTYGGPSLSAALRYVTPSPFYASIGILATIAGFGSEDGTTVSLPSSCTPGDFARGECEPGAGPRSAPGGSDGLYRPRTGSSRPTDGVLVYAGVPVTAGAEVASGEWGNVGVAGVFEPGYTRLVPSDGDGTGFLSLSGGGEVIVNVGGGAARAAAVTEDKDADGVADTDDECPSEAGPADNKGCPMEKLEGVETIGVVSAQAPDGAGQQFLVKLDPPRNGTITKAEIVGKDKTYGADVDPTKLSQTGELTVTPKEKLPAGKYTFRFELEENGEKKVGQAAFEVKDIAVLDVKITPDPANAPAEKTASEVSFGVVTNKAITIAPRFVLQGQTAGLQKNYYPDPKAYEVD